MCRWFTENYTNTVVFSDNVRLTDWPIKQLTDKQTGRQTPIQTDKWIVSLSSPLSWLQFGRMRPSCDATINWHCADSSSSMCFTSNQQVWFSLLESDVFTSVTWTRNSTKFLLNCRGWRIENNDSGILPLRGWRLHLAMIHVYMIGYRVPCSVWAIAFLFHWFSAHHNSVEYWPGLLPTVNIEW